MFTDRFFTRSRGLSNKSSFEGVDRDDQGISGHQIVSKDKFAESSAKLSLILKIIKYGKLEKVNYKIIYEYTFN
jgi:hypothetical protein